MASRARGKRSVAAGVPPSPRAASAAARRGDRAKRLVEALAAREHMVAAGLCGLLVLVYLWPVLVGGDVLSPAGQLYGFAPWRELAPDDLATYLNLLLIDVPTSYQPWDLLARDLLHAGTFPAWNPHAFAGTPLYANLSLAWLSPFSIPLWTLPREYAFGFAAALKLWTAAFGTYLLVRELRLGFWAGLVAGASFALCAFNVAWLSHGAHVSVAVLLPWTVWLVERIVVRGGGRVEGPALALVVAAALAGGHPGTQVHVLAGTLLYALVRTATIDGVARQQRLRRLATVGGGLVVGTLLMAVVLLPGERATVDAVGAEIRHNTGVKTIFGETLTSRSLLATAFPDWWGRPSEGLLAGPANYNERAFYAGTIALVLALVALVSPGAWRRKAGFACLGVLGIVVPLGLPPFEWLVTHLPGFDRVQNQRLLLWFAFAVAVLGAFGLQALLDAPKRQARAWAVVGAAAVAGAIAILSIDLAPGDAAGAVDHLTDRFAGLTEGALALSSVLRWLILVAVVAGALVLLRVRPQRGRLAGGLLALAAALDLLLFANAYQPMGPSEKVFPPRTPAVAYLQQHVGDGRIAGLSNSFTPDWSSVYGLRDVRGYDTPQPSRRWFELWQRTVSPQQFPWRPFDVASLAPTALRVLGMLGARYVTAEPGTELPGGEVRDVLSVAYRGADATVFENALASPRALVVSRVSAAADADEEIATVAEAGFDPRTDAVVHADGSGGTLPSGAGAGTVRVVGDENARVTLAADLERPSLVVLSDAWAPGWSVTVDERPAEALQANVVLRGVVVPAGRHEIVWSYRVPGLRAGAALSALGLAALLAWAGWLLTRARRGTR